MKDGAYMMVYGDGIFFLILRHCARYHKSQTSRNLRIWSKHISAMKINKMFIF
jgi:hypothetical protein